MKKPLVYFAKRVPYDSSSFEILPQSIFSLSFDEILDIYIKKNIEFEKFNMAGAWFFPKVQDKKFVLSPQDIWCILKKKIEICDVLIAEVCPKAYGTIMEAAYAGGRGNIAVYVFPKEGLSEEEIKDLWFVFNLSLSTKFLWKEEHFSESSCIFQKKISMKDYEAWLRSVIPKFLE